MTTRTLRLSYADGAQSGGPHDIKRFTLQAEPYGLCRSFVCLLPSRSAHGVGVAGTNPGKLRISFLSPQLDTKLKYAFVIDNYNYGGNLFLRPTSAAGPISVRADLSSDGVLKDGTRIGSLLVIPRGSSLAVGQSWLGFIDSPLAYDEQHPFVIMTVVSQARQTERTLANNSRARLLGNTSPSNARG